MENKTEKTAGRPREHQDGAARVAAFRAKAKYPGHRCDVYLEEAAYVTLCVLKNKTGLSTSGALNAVLSGRIKLSTGK